MIDTAESSMYLQELPSFSNEVILKADYGGWQTFKLRNLNINLKKVDSIHGQYRLGVKGSLTKYFHGNNFALLSLKDLSQCISDISNSLGAPFEKFHIHRFDFGTSISMDQKPFKYLRGLYSFKQLKRHTVSGANQSLETIKFKNSTFEILLYDKGLMNKKQREHIPPYFSHSNVIRYELVFRRREVKKLFGRLLVIEDLINPVNYKMLLEKWEQSFYQITKIAQVNFQTIKNFKEIRDTLAIRGLNQFLKKHSLDDMLNEAVSEGNMTSKTRSEIRSQIRSLLQKNSIVISTPLLKELANKVRVIKALNM